ncbi:MAG: ribose-5-phosphate isomerase, partial [Candidatus Marinimicrobia bacterium]|nr:ribose-5-phosphate isomerase [Candidatus Neomarinimicrobiota bacterium]
ANILSIGARFMIEKGIFEVLDLWIKESFEGGRHQRRIDKLDTFNN